MNGWQKLKWFVLSGITESIGEVPVNRLSSPKVTPTQAAPQPVAPDQSALTEQAKQVAEKATTLAELYAIREAFDGCPLKKTAGHTLNGRGAENPLVLCLVEAPDTADERDGQLVSGEAGVLFDKMLSAIGLSLAQNTYVAGLIPWRPPGNRKPTELESTVCAPFWKREIDLLKPKCILLFGAGASEEVLGINALSKARGKWHDYNGIPVRATLALGTLMKMPAQKKLAWEDLKQVRTLLDGLNTPTAPNE